MDWVDEIEEELRCPDSGRVHPLPWRVNPVQCVCGRWHELGEDWIIPAHDMEWNGEDDPNIYVAARKLIDEVRRLRAKCGE